MTFLGPIGVIVLGIVSLILFIVPTVRTITFTDDNPNMQGMRPQVTKIVGSTLLGMVALLFVSMLYFLQDEKKAMSTVFVMICLTLGLSFSALAMSTLS
jgi:tellurite resistance protein TehA-like permease